MPRLRIPNAQAWVIERRSCQVGKLRDNQTHPDPAALEADRFLFHAGEFACITLNFDDGLRLESKRIELRPHMRDEELSAMPTRR